MKRCMLCGEDKEEVSMYPVAPATWNAFNNFAMACAECAALTKNRVRLRLTKSTTKAAAAAATAVAEETAASAGPKVTIAHRRTGEALLVVDNPTLAHADLSGAALNGADLQHSDLNGATLKKADLRLSDLSGANLKGADLRAANLRGADLRGTDLRAARLEQADLVSARYDRFTAWPDGFDPRSSGAQAE